jgi:rhodanese-related sulfurtransferase
MRNYLHLIILNCILIQPVLATEYPEISVEQLKSAITKGEVAVIDVNGKKSFQQGHIPTAIDYSSSYKDLASLLPADKSVLVVAYCGGPSCRAYLKGATSAAALGYKNIRHLSAGISGWKKAGLKLAKP